MSKYIPEERVLTEHEWFRRRAVDFATKSVRRGIYNEVAKHIASLLSTAVECPECARLTALLPDHFYTVETMQAVSKERDSLASALAASKAECARLREALSTSVSRADRLNVLVESILGTLERETISKYGRPYVEFRRGIEKRLDEINAALKETGKETTND